MKTTAQINIERLSKADRETLASFELEVLNFRHELALMTQRYEGPSHTVLDRLHLELAEASASLRKALGGEGLDLFDKP